MSLSTLMVAATLVGGATFADFSDAGTSTGNTFTAGTLDMQINGLDNVATAVWQSPSNWAPGDTFKSVVKLNNIGSVNAKHVYFGFSDVKHDSPRAVDNSNLLEKIIVTNLEENFNGTIVSNQAASIDSQVGNNDGKLTLKEFSDFMQNGYGYYSWDDKSGDDLILAANKVAADSDYSLTFEFTFDSSAGNEYQGDTAGFTLMLNATQNSPTEGLVALHQ